MKLTVIGSGSSGNCYLLDSGTQVLIVEAGCQFKEIKKALNFDITPIAGCIVSHRHYDHSLSILDLVKSGIKVYTGQETIDGLDIGTVRNIIPIKAMQEFMVGGFKILPFDAIHDVPCLGFLINHPQSGNILFLTDSCYVKYKFPGLNHLMVECNYSEEVIADKYFNGDLHKVLKTRIELNHLSLSTCKDLLLENDLSKVNNIVLLHLSNSNSSEEKFKKEITEVTGKNVMIANKGLTMDFNLRAF